MSDQHLSPAERAHYHRHLLLPDVGEAGQRRLKAARVLLVGCGGLGSPVALYLAAAGVGRLDLVDFDRVDTSNLQRQILFGTPDVGRPKVEVAAERLRTLNPHIEVVPHDTRLSAENARGLAEHCDLIVDGADNFSTRYLTNDLAVLTGKPLIYGAIFQFDGQVSVFGHPGGPCYRCLYPSPPPPELAPSCAEAGVLGVLPGLVGVLQATEALKHLLGLGEPLAGRLLTVDALTMQFRELRFPRDPACPACGDHPSITELADLEVRCDAFALTELAGSPFLLDVRSAAEAAQDSLGGTLIPLPELPRRLGEIPRNSQVVVYCAVGRRSARAVEILRAQGFDAWHLAGGLAAWRAAGR